MKIPGQVSAQINIQFLYRERAARHARPAHLDPMIGGRSGTGPWLHENSACGIRNRSINALGVGSAL
jgi:hypothetical protein